MKRPILEPDDYSGPAESETAALLALLNGNQSALDRLVLTIRQCRVLRPAYVAAKQTSKEVKKDADDLLAAFRKIAEISEARGEAWHNLFDELDALGADPQIKILNRFSFDDVIERLIEAAENNVVSLKTSPGRQEKPDGFVRDSMMAGLAASAQIAGLKVTKYPESAFFKIAEIAYPMAGFFIDPTNDIDAFMRKK